MSCIDGCRAQKCRPSAGTRTLEKKLNRLSHAKLDQPGLAEIDMRRLQAGFSEVESFSMASRPITNVDWVLSFLGTPCSCHCCGLCQTRRSARLSLKIFPCAVS